MYGGYGVYHNPDFDLFIAEYVFQDFDSYQFDEPEFESYNRTVFNDIPSSVWQPNDSLEKLPVEWIINKNELETLDSVILGIKNISDNKFYYMTWGAPNSRLRIDYFIYKNGSIDSLLYNGFGCGTGIYLAPLYEEETAESKRLNPLLLNPYSNEELDRTSDSFPTIIKTYFGDSVGIRLRLATYSLPWNKHEPQMIGSETMMIHTDKIIQEWNRKNNNKKHSQDFIKVRKLDISDSTNTLTGKNQILELKYIVWGCACAPWVELSNAKKSPLTDHCIYIEEKDSTLLIPNDFDPSEDKIVVRGQFYKKPDFPKGTPETEEPMVKAPVFSYDRLRIEKL